MAYNQLVAIALVCCCLLNHADKTCPDACLLLSAVVPLQHAPLQLSSIAEQRTVTLRCRGHHQHLGLLCCTE
jgi:hypothetical protein